MGFSDKTSNSDPETILYTSLLKMIDTRVFGGIAPTCSLAISLNTIRHDTKFFLRTRPDAFIYFRMLANPAGLDGRTSPCPGKG